MKIGYKLIEQSFLELLSNNNVYHDREDKKCHLHGRMQQLICIQYWHKVNYKKSAAIY